MTVSMDLVDQIQQVNDEEVLQKKLHFPRSQLTLVEKIALIVGGIQAGEDNAKKIDGLESKSPIFFLGNTGCGKSTMINYLAGCQLEYLEGGTIAPDRVVIVQKGSQPAEIMKIGHRKVSETFIPTIASIENRSYCDCPGFLDSHGPEVSVVNIVNIRRFICGSKDVRIVLLVNWHSLLADKAKGFKETTRIAMKFFGNQQNFMKYSDSILFGVTKMQATDVSSPNQLEIGKLKKWISNSDGIRLDSYEQEVVNAFAKNLFLYHPLDAIESLKYSGGIQREELLKKIDGLPRISNREVFKISLTAQDLHRMTTICNELSKEIKKILQKKSTTSDTKKYQDTSLLLDYIAKIEEVNHPEIHHLVQQCLNTVVDHFKGLRFQLIEELSQTPDAITHRGEELFKTISGGMKALSMRYQSHVEEKMDMESLKQIYEKHRKRVGFKKAEKQLLEEVSQFRSKCENERIKDAEVLLQKMHKEYKRLNESAKDLNLSWSFDLSKLENRLDKAKASLNQRWWLKVGMFATPIATGIGVLFKSEMARTVVLQGVGLLVRRGRLIVNAARPFIERAGRAIVGFFR